MDQSLPSRDIPDTARTIARHKARAWESANSKARKQVLADWYEHAEGLNTQRNVRPITSIVSALVNKWTWLNEEPLDPVALRKGWIAAAGAFISSHSELISISQGSAIVRVLQPTIRAELMQLRPHLLKKLQTTFPHEKITALKINIG